MPKKKSSHWLRKESTWKISLSNSWYPRLSEVLIRGQCKRNLIPRACRQARDSSSPMSSKTFNRCSNRITLCISSSRCMRCQRNKKGERRIIWSYLPNNNSSSNSSSCNSLYKTRCKQTMGTNKLNSSRAIAVNSRHRQISELLITKTKLTWLLISPWNNRLKHNNNNTIRENNNNNKLATTIKITMCSDNQQQPIKLLHSRFNNNSSSRSQLIMEFNSKDKFKMHIHLKTFSVFQGAW